MGSVWAARHLALDTGVAIKFIGPEVEALEEARTRFEREAKVAALLQSPHVVQVIDYGVDGVPYLVMELLQGEDLGARLARRGRLSLGETVEIVTQVARALRRAADAGIVHRDLKPGNVFIVRGDEDEEVVKVLDFGVAKAPRLTTDDTTRAGVLVGSPRYMSPEQVRGVRCVDHRSDLWSLAVIAYRALTGQLPFQGVDVADLIVRICAERPEPPSKIESWLSPEIDEFFARALSVDPEARFQTAREMALAFADAAGEMVPPSLAAPRLPRMVPPRPATRSRRSLSPRGVPRVPLSSFPGPPSRPEMSSRPPLSPRPMLSSRPEMSSRPEISPRSPLSSRPQMASRAPLSSRPDPPRSVHPAALSSPRPVLLSPPMSREAESNADSSVTIDPANERTRTTLDASRTRAREAHPESEEVSSIQRSSEPDGTITSAPRSIEVHPATARPPPLRANFGRVAIAAGIAAAVLIGIFVGRAVGPGNTVVIAPSSAGAPVLVSAWPAALPVSPTADPVVAATAVRDAIAPAPSSSADPEEHANDPRGASPAPSAKARARRKQGP
ncbi:serine/threonine protein kinase [Minicystis rosea]|nr:serine/threonine protein kinase [Minicystis rosea]